MAHILYCEHINLSSYPLTIIIKFILSCKTCIVTKKAHLSRRKKFSLFSHDKFFSLFYYTSYTVSHIFPIFPLRFLHFSIKMHFFGLAKERLHVFTDLPSLFFCWSQSNLFSSFFPSLLILRKFL